jgi:hypothetical protein
MDRLRFVHCRGLRKFNVDLFWGDIVDVYPYDRIRDVRGREYDLRFIDKVCMDRILNYMEKPENLMIENMKGIANLDTATRRMRTEPTGGLTVKGISPSNLADKVIWSLVIIPSFLFSLLILYWSLEVMWKAGIVAGGVISALLGMAVISFLIHVIRSMREKHLEIDRRGARLILKGAPLWDFEWKEILKVSNSKGRSRRYLDFSPVKGMNCSVSSDQFGSKDLKEAFNLARKYCDYHGIRIDNRVGW